MGDISTFPTNIGPSLEEGPTMRFIAGAAIKANQVVCFAATGVANTVIPCVATAGTWPVGVAVFAAASGAPVTVAVDGAVIDVVNADDTTAIEAGDFLEMNDNAVGGTVNAVTLTPSGATATPHYVVGVALEAIAGGGYGKCMVKCMQVTQPNAS